MPAPTSDYYSLEKTAEVLGLPTAEVNRLREKSMLRAFRDGTSWKFRKTEVDDYLAQIIKNRGKAAPDAADAYDVASDSGFDLLNSSDDGEEAPTLLADSASFDSLMEDGDGLAINEGLLDVKPKTPQNKPDASPKKQPEKSDIDLADDGLALAESGTSSNLDLAGDSGLSLMDIAEEDLKPDKSGSDAELELDEDSDILSLSDDSALAENTQAVVFPKEDDFQLADMEEDTALTADTQMPSGAKPSSKSPSVSEQIPDFAGTAAADDFGTFDAPDGDLANDMFGGGVVPQPESPFASANAVAPADNVFTAPGTDAPAFSGDFTSAPSTAFSAAAAKTEAEYKAGTVVSLITLAVILVFPGIMLLDLMRNIWSWGEPFVVNSALMDMIVGMVGLK